MMRKWNISRSLSGLFSVLLLAGFLVMLAAPLSAAVTVVGATVTMTWTEPTLNEDGSPLTDLDVTVGTYQVPNGTEIICDADQPATDPTGGGSVSVTCTVPISPQTEQDVEFRAYAIDAVGNSTTIPANLTIRIDNLAPAAPAF